MFSCLLMNCIPLIILLEIIREDVNMMLHDSFSRLEERLNNNDPRAAEEIFERYVNKLIRLVSPRLLGSMRQKLDPEDLVQSALGSFFRRNAKTPFTLNSWDNLGALLATITLRKCRYRIRQFSTAMRQVKREEHLEQMIQLGVQLDARSSEPTPLESATCEDTLTQLLNSLHVKSRQICELALLGFSSSEIAAKADLTERSVFRQLEHIRGKLRAMNEDLL